MIDLIIYILFKGNGTFVNLLSIEAKQISCNEIQISSVFYHFECIFENLFKILKIVAGAQLVNTGIIIIKIRQEMHGKYFILRILYAHK